VNSNFRLYSAYYDLLYEDKDYKSEAAYVDQHLRKWLPGTGEILELGSGTGNHAQFLAGYGYKITGVERSEAMIEQSRQKSIIGFNPVLSDITNFRFDQQFDAALSLFHSMCYLTTNDQLITAFSNINRHLKPGGMFAFDFWYGPAVLHHLPAGKTKYRENESLQVSRHGTTTMYIDQNVAEVNYDVIVQDKRSGVREIIHETHPMRYFSIPEIALIGQQTGFEMIGFEEFLTSAQPTLESWNIFVLLRKTV
jgi:SAM-dependent methyltransferase